MAPIMIAAKHPTPACSMALAFRRRRGAAVRPQGARWAQARERGSATGVQIVRRAIQASARQIAQNAGEDGSVIVGKTLDQSSYAQGWNAQSGEYGDMFKAGVIDPAKVVRSALQDAASVAGLLITTGAMVAEKLKKEAPPAAPAWAAWISKSASVCLRRRLRAAPFLVSAKDPRPL